MKKNKVSINVLTYNRNVLHCLESIKNNTVNEYEIILVDNSNNYRKEYKEYIDKYIGIKNKGVLSRNYGRLISEYDYILNVDDDVLVLPEWDQILIDFIESDSNIMASGQMGHRAYPDLSNYNMRMCRVGELADFITGFCWGYKNNGSYLLPSDWFSPSGKPSALHDETWIQCLMRERGYKFITSPVVCNHISKRTSVDFDDDADKIKRIKNRFKIENLHLEK